MIEAGAFTIGADHPALPGHFPDNPVVPGVTLLAHATAAILAAFPGRRVAGLPQVKFLRPVRAGDEVSVWYAPSPLRVGFACRVGGDEVVRGMLVLE